MLSKNFDDYQVEDFVADESFINYWIYKKENDTVFWEQWLLEHPEKKYFADEAKQMLQMLSLSLPEEEYDKELKRIKKAIAQQQILFTKTVTVHHLPNYNKNTYKTKRRRALKYFVPLLLVVLMAAYFVFTNKKNDVDKLITAYNKSNAAMMLTLSDNTVVTLASNSSLTYAKTFTGAERNVYLKGTAAFTVTHDAAHPFKVHEDEIVTTVLGTVFNVKKDVKNSNISVELLRGKVSVEAFNTSNKAVQSVILYPDEKVVYSETDKLLQKGLMFVSTRRAENIMFKNDDFNTIAKNFKDLFGVTVINESSKTNWRFTGDFKNITANELVENICIAENLNYKFQNDTIVIK